MGVFIFYEVYGGGGLIFWSRLEGEKMGRIMEFVGI